MIRKDHWFHRVERMRRTMRVMTVKFATGKGGMRPEAPITRYSSNASSVTEQASARCNRTINRSQTVRESRYVILTIDMQNENIENKTDAERNIICRSCGYIGDINTYQPSFSIHNDCRCPKCYSTDNDHNDRFQESLVAAWKKHDAAKQ